MIKKKFPDIPLLVSCHGSDLRQFQNLPKLQRRVKEGCLQADGVLALSQTQKKDICSLYGFEENKVSVVGAGYDHTLFSAKAQVRQESVNLVYAGKLSRAKGLIYFLRALQGSDESNWVLHLLGDGTGKEKEEVLAQLERFNGQVIHHGLLPHKKMAGFLQQADIFVLPSLFEGLPLVLLEALACDCRLITCKLPGVKELFDEITCNEIEMVDLPRLKNLDEVFEEDEGAFVNRLSEAFDRQFKHCLEKKKFDKKQFSKLLSSYTWPGIFKKIERLYFAQKT